MTEPNPAEWLSAWSTLWAAIFAGIGAIGTVGALWVGALTLRRQINDQHRQQASAVTVGIKLVKPPMYGARYVCFILNASNLPIYNVRLHSNFDGETATQRADVLEPGNSLDYDAGLAKDRKVLGEFVDSSGHEWMRNGRGRLLAWKRPSRLRAILNLRHVYWAKYRPDWLKRRDK